MNKKALEIILHYGILKQLKYFQSEVYELNEAIIQNECILDYEQENIPLKKHIIEELADVLVMITQFKEYYGITIDEIEEVMNYKINRQLERIKNDI